MENIPIVTHIDSNILLTHCVKAFTDNYIWLIQGSNSHADRVVIVDPGDANPVLHTLKQYHLQPAAVFITHHHADHCGGISKITRQFNIPVYGPAREHIPGITHPCQQDDVIEIPACDLKFTVWDVPGHTKGHIAFYGHNALFIGDTLFAGGCGKIFGGTYEQLFQSMQKILTLDPQTLIYCAHEYTLENLEFAKIVEPDNPALIQRIADTKQLQQTDQATVPSRLELEQQTNPFLRFDQADVIDAVQKYYQQNISDPQVVFRITRMWKDMIDNG